MIDTQIHHIECYYTIIDFNEVDIRIYLPEIVNVIFKGRWILMFTEIEANNCFVIWPFF